MGLINAIAGDTAISAVTAIGNVFDKVFTSDEEKLIAEQVMEKIRQQPSIAQTEINKIEAQHRSIFVAGWRPFIGWVCGSALLWHFMLHDIFVWLAIAGGGTQPPEISGTEHLITVLMALLGLGTLRTVEKLNGRTK